MAFCDFKYPEVLQQFELTFDNADDLFPGVPPTPASLLLLQQLRLTAGLASTINTEKARSEWMIAPILADLWARYHGRIGLYSGVTFGSGVRFANPHESYPVCIAIHGARSWPMPSPN